MLKSCFEHRATRYSIPKAGVWRACFSRFARFLGAAALVVPLVTSLPTAHAQAPGMPSMLTMKELHLVSVGQWARYRVKIANRAPMTYTVGVVARSESTTTLEMVLTGGMAARLGQLVAQVELSSDPADNYAQKKAAVQFGNNPAMEIPAFAAGTSPLRQIAPEALGGNRTELTVLGGTFQTIEVSQASSDMSYVAWMSEKVGPFGLVKMDAQTAQGSVTLEFVEQGSGAKSKISGEVKPFDPAALMKMFSALSRAQAPQKTAEADLRAENRTHTELSENGEARKPNRDARKSRASTGPQRSGRTTFPEKSKEAAKKSTKARRLSREAAKSEARKAARARARKAAKQKRLQRKAEAAQTTP